MIILILSDYRQLIESEKQVTNLIWAIDYKEHKNSAVIVRQIRPNLSLILARFKSTKKDICRQLSEEFSHSYNFCSPLLLTARYSCWFLATPTRCLPFMLAACYSCSMLATPAPFLPLLLAPLLLLLAPLPALCSLLAPHTCCLPLLLSARLSCSPLLLAAVSSYFLLVILARCSSGVAGDLSNKLWQGGYRPTTS